MQTNVSVFVKVDCQAHSRHRDPGGVYLVDLKPEESLLHCACAAIEIVRSHAPFVEENLDKLTMRVFNKDGSEIPVSTQVDPKYHEYGSYQGRASDYPEEVTIQ